MISFGNLHEIGKDFNYNNQKLYCAYLLVAKNCEEVLIEKKKCVPSCLWSTSGHLVKALSQHTLCQSEIMDTVEILSSLAFDLHYYSILTSGALEAFIALGSVWFIHYIFLFQFTNISSIACSSPEAHWVIPTVSYKICV